MKIAIIGLGYWGEKILTSLIRIKIPKNNIYVYDIDKHKRQIANKYSVNFSENLKGVLDKTELVIISTPEETHFKIAQRCLKENKHLLVEKPLTTNLDESIKLVRIAQKNSLVLMVDSTYLYDKSFIYIKKLIDSGIIGKITSIYSFRFSPNIIKPNINVILDLMPHDISIFTKIFTQNPEIITVITQRQKNKKFDNANVFLNFNGPKTFSYLSWTYPEKKREMIFYGQDGTLYWKQKNNTSDFIYRYNNQGKLISKKEIYNKNNTLNYVIKEFVRSVRYNREPNTSGKNGLLDIKILENILKHIK